MRQYLLLFFLLLTINLFAQEGTKQFMPNSNDRLWPEFQTFSGNNFGMYGCDLNERINIHLNLDENVFFVMKINTFNYGGKVYTRPERVSFRIKDPDGFIVYAQTFLSTFVNNTEYTSTYTQVTTGPNGAILNGTTISGGYNPFTLTAAKKGDYYIEFQTWQNDLSGGVGNLTQRRRFALEYFDVTVTDAANNVKTNPGEPNKSVGGFCNWQG
jgi:hypothetical protein